MHQELTLQQVRVIAEIAHEHQKDKIGQPYFGHVTAVATALTAFGPKMVMAGYLHDIIEDTPWDADHLRSVGVNEDVVQTVEAVTNQAGKSYLEMINQIAMNPRATLVKIADNAHNSLPDRSAAIAEESTRRRLGEKYLRARRILWAAADPADIALVLKKVNPHLLPELSDSTPVMHSE